MNHELKTRSEYFWQIVEGNKTFEIRKDDREFKPGDTLLLDEWTGEIFTGNWIKVDVLLVLRSEYCKDGYCTMSIIPRSANCWRNRTNADRLRAKSDKELAQWLAEKTANQSIMRIEEEGYAPTAIQISAFYAELTAAWLNWLKKEAETNGGSD